MLLLNNPQQVHESYDQQTKHKYQQQQRIACPVTGIACPATGMFVWLCLGEEGEGDVDYAPLGSGTCHWRQWMTGHSLVMSIHRPSCIHPRSPRPCSPYTIPTMHTHATRQYFSCCIICIETLMRLLEFFLECIYSMSMDRASLLCELEYYSNTSVALSLFNCSL